MKPIDVGRQRPGRAIQTRLLNDRARAAELLSRGQTLDAFGPSMDSRALRELPFYARLSSDEDGGGVPYSFTEVYAQPGESNHEPITWAELPGGRTGTKAYPLRQTADMSGRVVKLRKSADDDSYWFDYKRLGRKTPEGGGPCSGCGTVPSQIDVLQAGRPWRTFTYQRTPADLDGKTVCIYQGVQDVGPNPAYFKFADFGWFSGPTPIRVGDAIRLNYDYAYVAQCRLIIALNVIVAPSGNYFGINDCQVAFPTSYSVSSFLSQPFPPPPKEDGPPPDPDADTCDPFVIRHWFIQLPGVGVLEELPLGSYLASGSGERITLDQSGSAGGLKLR
ncbi:hypothetical protein [Singulisphaera sp. PoT]|uniref:hypothetical protein n=1 Tax=Singulisphaera sp. PoT TaxID=3411797 RepID=UPI003BF5B92E